MCHRSAPSHRHHALRKGLAYASAVQTTWKLTDSLGGYFEVWNDPYINRTDQHNFGIKLAGSLWTLQACLCAGCCSPGKSRLSFHMAQRTDGIITPTSKAGAAKLVKKNFLEAIKSNDFRKLETILIQKQIDVDTVFEVEDENMVLASYKQGKKCRSVIVKLL